MISIYFFLEVIIMAFLTTSNIFENDIAIIGALKLAAVILNFILSFNNKFDKKLRLALALVVVADICFILLDNCALGIAVFIIK